MIIAAALAFGAVLVPRTSDAVVLAANRTQSWRHTRSSAGARGPMQFMRGTWNMLRRQYRSARLSPFEYGARGLGMSIRAAALLIDASLAYFDDAHRTFLRAHPEAFAQYSAAAYNGNPKHAVRAIAGCEDRWTEASCGRLSPETTVYLDTVAAVWPIVTAPNGISVASDP